MELTYCPLAPRSMMRLDTTIAQNEHVTTSLNTALTQEDDGRYLDSRENELHFSIYARRKEVDEDRTC
jgi:hypothetical protein